MTDERQTDDPPLAPWAIRERAVGDILTGMLRQHQENNPQESPIPAESTTPDLAADVNRDDAEHNPWAGSPSQIARGDTNQGEPDRRVIALCEPQPSKQCHGARLDTQDHIVAESVKSVEAEVAMIAGSAHSVAELDAPSQSPPSPLPLPCSGSTSTGVVMLSANQVSTKRGFPVYRTNPSVPMSGGISTRTKRFHVPGGKASVIVDHSSGEIKGLGGMGFWWEEEVDTTRFVKLFLDGIKQAAGLSKAGMQVFEMVYHQVRANPGTDEIKLNLYVAKDHGLSDRTYQRGVRELLEKEFIYRSPSDGVFFVNIRFMFNGDRLAFVRSYHLKEPARQHELALSGPDKPTTGSDEPP